MQSWSRLALLQQVTTLALVALSLGWLGWHWADSPAKALGGFFLIALFYSLVLGLQFVVLRVVGRHDPAPRPSWGELARAWLLETKIAPIVFCWRQPFRWRDIPDQPEAAPNSAARRGVVLIHGFVCNRGLWNPWLGSLKERGHSFVAVNLEPVFGSIDEYVPIIDSAIRRITQSTGIPPVVVCHSMGGLAIRAWMLQTSGGNRVHHVITIGSPHHGTWWGRFGIVENGAQMRIHSDWLGELDAAGQADHHKFTCWYSNCDNIVFPASTATLAGADNRHVPGVPHVALAFDDRVMRESLDIIREAPR
jgi:predicted alpha/beta hydrolase family esterase